MLAALVERYWMNPHHLVMAEIRQSETLLGATYTDRLRARMKVEKEVYRVTEILRYFEFDHLPEGEPRKASYVCHALAHTMAENIPPSAELTAGLRKLLEAKDCFYRASLPK